MAPPSYAPLYCKSHYSFLEGASHPEELLERAAELGIQSLALTDRDGVYGAVRAHVKARELGLHLVVGARVSVADGSSILLLAADGGSYTHLCRLISAGRLRSPKGQSVVEWREVCAHAGGLVALWGGEESLLVREPEPAFVARDLRDAFGDRLYALVTRHRRAEEAPQERRLRERARRYGIPTAAAAEVLYHHASRRRLQDVLTCIRHGVPLADAGRLIKPNAEHDLKSPAAFAALFRDDPDSVARTLEVTARCAFSLDELRYRYPSEELPDGKTSREWLREIAFEGARERNRGSVPDNLRAQLERELRVIGELAYEGYFLTMWDLVRFCRENGILCQGRGSAANSAVCYCLGITAVDPVQMDLLFERFISMERAEPPDIDLDIEHDRREEVIQYLYRKHSRTHAAMVANFIRYRGRSAVRDVGKVLGLAETALNRISKLAGNFERVDPQLLENAGFDPRSRVHQDFLGLVAEIQDFPRHLSIHPGGFLLGHKPVRDLVPIENAAMPDRTVIQWDKEDLESLKLFKVDLLGLGMLTVVDRSFRLIRKHWGRTFSLATIPSDDPETYAMICKADTVGVFQIESRAQMSMLPRLKPREYYDLVIEVSIVRPGPIAGGMVHPYLRRRNGEEAVTYPHPSLEPVLKKTLGVPLFQEQVMRLAVVAADYTPGEADQLRRDMAAWRRSGRIERHRERLISRMEAKGIGRDFATQVFEQIRGFGDYGFPESHAASFALVAYASSWLKRHYPAAFACALLNAQPMGFYAPATIVDDARRHGVRVLPVDVRHSDWDCTLERQASGQSGAEGADGDGVPGGSGQSGKAGGQSAARAGDPSAHAVRIGMRYVKGLRDADWQRIDDARHAGPFRSVTDFASRTGLRQDVLDRLAEAGALSSRSPHRRQALWQVRGVHAAGADATRGRPGPGARVQGLHEAGRDALPLETPEAPVPFEPLSDLESIVWDYRTTDHSPRGHPLTHLRRQLAALGLPDAAAVQRMPHGRRVDYAGIVISRQRPKTAKGVIFLTLEDETGFVNVILWRDVYERFRIAAKTLSFMGVSGPLQSESTVVHLVAESVWQPKIGAEPVRRKSRDFQ